MTDVRTPPRCRRLTSELEAANARATALAKTLTPAQLNWKPRPEVWSIGQCLEHLCVANEVYLPAVSSALAGRQPAPVEEINRDRIMVTAPHPAIERRPPRHTESLTHFRGRAPIDFAAAALRFTQS